MRGGRVDGIMGLACTVVRERGARAGGEGCTVDAIRVMIVDDHPLFRQGLRRVLELEPDIKIEAEAVDGQQAVELAAQLKPEVILMDINLPGLNGLQATRRIKGELPDVAVIVVTGYDYEEQMLHAIRAGASAYFPKFVPPAKLIEAIREAKQGNYVINDDVLDEPRVARWLLDQFEQYPESYTYDVDSPFVPLSSREMEILEYITKGHSNKEIANELDISRQTVKNHMTAILRKLAVNDRTQAAVYALRHGWVRLEDTKAEGA